jgi:hypothetical protein
VKKDLAITIKGLLVTATATTAGGNYIIALKKGFMV